MSAKSPVPAGSIQHRAGFFGSVHAKLWIGVAALSVLAITASAHGLTTISRSYTTNDSLSLGSMVSLQKNSSSEVDAATISNVNNILGVVIHDRDSLLSLSGGQTKQIQVATNGSVPVLVSDINGAVAEGDSITASPISGVGMKATSNVKIIGVAQESLSSDNGTKQSYTDKDGQKHTTIVGSIPVMVNVSYYYKQPDKTIIPSAVQNIANALAGKPVNTLPILISAGVFIVTLMVVVSIIYSMIRSSIISIGRNPMSQSAVYRGVIQLSALIVGILGAAIISIYLILTRF